MDNYDLELLTDSKRLEGALAMAGSICHELNQPLQAIVGYLQLLEMDIEQKDLDSDTRNKIVKLMTEIDRISDITRKLATINKYKTKNYSGNQTIVDIDKSCE